MIALNNHGNFAQAEVVLHQCLAQVLRYLTFYSRFWALFGLDHQLFDIAPAELDEYKASCVPRISHQIADWSDQDCYSNTGFRKDHLREIYYHFGLQQVADAAPHIGYIAVPTNQGKHNLFSPEEMFLFFMTRMRTGIDKKALCRLLFGGHPSRWSFGWDWIVKYLDERYARTISHQKLEDDVDQFPEFYDAISNFMQKDTHKFHAGGAGNGIEMDGLNFCPFPIFGFIDCSIDKVCRPHSGPAGDYVGAPRKPNEDIYQRSVYSGYKKFHGIKVETILLPNGIMTLFGPISARIHDLTALNMGQLDNFLSVIQQGQEHVYLAFGDGGYNAHYLNCESSVLFIDVFTVSDKLFVLPLCSYQGIRSYIVSLNPDVELSDAERLCNRRMRTCRQTIEHCYGDIENIFRICTHSGSVKLGYTDNDGTPSALRQLRLCHLLMNIYVCLNGSKASSHLKFDCSPPKLRDYLAL